MMFEFENPLPQSAMDWLNMLEDEEKEFAEKILRWLIENSPLPETPKRIGRAKRMCIFYHCQSLLGNGPYIYLDQKEVENEGSRRRMD